MFKLGYSNQFLRDYKKYYKETISPSWIEALYLLLNSNSLPVKYCDHALTGNWKDHRDCHIKPDLVLIYTFRENDLVLVRLGSHSELGI